MFDKIRFMQNEHVSAVKAYEEETDEDVEELRAADQPSRGSVQRVVQEVCDGHTRDEPVNQVTDQSKFKFKIVYIDAIRMTVRSEKNQRYQ